MISVTSPNEHLVQYMRKYPETGRMINLFMEGRGKDLPDWPQWCFLPMSGFYAIVSNHINVDRLGLFEISDVPILSALGTWRYTQSIYRFHPDLLGALAASTIFGDLPAEMFQRLPEWCLYVETPGLTRFGKSIEGFFVHLEYDVNTSRSELRFLFNMENGELESAILHIGNWTVEEAVRRALDESKQISEKINIDLFQNYDPEMVVKAFAEELNGFVSIVLYLCSNDPDIEDLPRRPEPVKTKKGPRYFPPNNSRIVHVGNQVGEKLRVQRLAGNMAGKMRGRWQGYWSGSDFVCRWIPPIADK